jgi:hypothetical protein
LNAISTRPSLSSIRWPANSIEPKLTVSCGLRQRQLRVPVTRATGAAPVEMCGVALATIVLLVMRYVSQLEKAATPTIAAASAAHIPLPRREGLGEGFASELSSSNSNDDRPPSSKLSFTDTASDPPSAYRQACIHM